MKMLKGTITKVFFSVVITILFSSYSQLLAQDFWYPTNGPYGGKILVLAENGSGRVFAGTEGGGIFRSTNNGNSWQEINEGIPIGVGRNGFQVYSILAFSNVDILIGTSKEGRIFRSSDNGDNWTQVYNSPVSSDITNCFLYAPSGSILAGLDGTGIIRSTNNGDTWNATSLTAQNIRQTIAADNGNLIAATNEGIYKSTDDGINWALSNSGLSNTNISELNKNTIGVLFCVTVNNRLFKSTDNGNNWVEVGFMPASPTYCLSFNSSNEMYAGTLYGIYKSTNDGSSWTEDSLHYILTRTILFNNSDDLFAGTDLEGVYRSQQANSPYEKINTGLKNTFITAMTFSLDSVLYVGTNSQKFLTTSNFGNTWIDISEKIFAFGGIPKVLSLLTHPNGDIIAGTFYGGIFRTTNNGDYWLNELPGPTPIHIFSLALDNQANILAGSSGKLYKSTNYGEDWTDIDNGQINHNIYDIAVNSLGHIFAATYGGVFRSTDNGNSWTQINNGLLYNYAYAIAINDSDDIFVTGEMAGIYKSTDNGDSWTSVLTATLPAYDIIINDLGDIFVSSIDAQGVLRSIDNGATWQQINSGLYNYSVRSLCLSPSSFLIAGSEGTGVWISGLPTGSNLFGGNSNLGLPIQHGIGTQDAIVIHSGPGANHNLNSDYPIESLMVTLQEITHPDISELVVTLEHEGIVDTLVYQPGVNGANFLGTKFKDEALLDLSQGTAPFTGSFKPKSSLSAFNGAEATGNWTITINDLVPANDGVFEAWSIALLTETSTDVKSTDAPPSEFTLFQNYPNPFNPSTSIQYQVSSISQVSLKVYDLLGREVATLVNEDKPAGSYEVEFDAKGLSSGIYFYKIQAGSFVETKKMLLLK
jgi:photosystem II stability/assembly factor-like uncharacterized protein